MGTGGNEGSDEMTYNQAVELVQRWPEDRTVPRKLKAGIDSAQTSDKTFMEQLVEALMVAAETKADFALITEYFG